MPPTLVRPQTFTVLQQPDSASPAVRFVSEQNFYLWVPWANAIRQGRSSYLICVLQGCISHCPVSLSQSANFSAPSEKLGTSTVRLSVPVVWVGHRPLPLLYNLRNQLGLKIWPRIWRWATPNGVGATPSLIELLLVEPPRRQQESSKPCLAFLSLLTAWAV